jgi:DNA-directed RNA polymerase subunit H (RpoH/RPB5)
MAEIEIVRAHVKEMLEVRGDDATYIEEHGDAVESTRYFSEVITLDTDKTTVFYAITKDVLREWKSDDAHESHETLLAKYKGYKQFILILGEQPPSATLNKLIAMDKSLVAVGGILQVFYVKELLYNPTKHTLVPPHERLTESEGKKILDTYMIKQKSQMPIISRNDVIARWLGLRQGDIVRITRYNETSGTYYYYRCCV